MLRDPLAGRALFRALTGGQHASAAEDLLERYDTTASPAARRAIEDELREAVGEALGEAQERVGELRHEVLNGSLGTPMDTQLYELVPGAVDRVASGLHLARTQGSSMTHGDATGASVLEAGVAHHTGEVAHDRHLAEAAVFGAGIAFGLFAGLATGGAGAAAVAGLLRTAMIGAGRYSADSAAVENARAAAAAGLATAGDVQEAEATRQGHVLGAVAEASAEVLAAGAAHEVEHGLVEAAEHAATTDAASKAAYQAVAGAIAARFAEAAAPQFSEHAGVHFAAHAGAPAGHDEGVSHQEATHAEEARAH